VHDLVQRAVSDTSVYSISEKLSHLNLNVLSNVEMGCSLSLLSSIKNLLTLVSVLPALSR
jgi:hypothetical protein